MYIWLLSNKWFSNLTNFGHDWKGGTFDIGVFVRVKQGHAHVFDFNGVGAYLFMSGHNEPMQKLQQFTFAHAQLGQFQF